MKAEPAEQHGLLELAKVDTELSRLQHRRRTLPESAEVEEAEKTLRQRKDALVSAQTAASDMDREVERQEREVESVRARRDKDQQVLRDGSVSAKQLADLEHEVGTLQRRQTALEDDQLELMERREALDMDVQRNSAEVDVAEEQLAEATRRRDESLADIDTTTARREADRETLVAKVGEQLLSVYEQVRAQKGTGAALLRARRCGACQLELDRSTLAEIKNTAADEVVRCENCGAILVRTAESGL